MLMTLLLFVSGLALSSISTIYAVIGLLSIFPAAPTTIMIMGSALEVSKLVIASWLYRNWFEIPKFLKVYFCVAMVVLMFLTSMSIFGMLSKAHIDSGVVSNETVASLQIIDDKIKTQQENILQSKKALTQMDAQVNEMLSRTTDEKGTDKAIKVRGLQKKERLSLSSEINLAQSEISKLQVERVPLAISVRKVEAEVGPIKYIANLIYGDNVDSNMLERAVRIVILMIVFVFDPLAVLLLIAANWNLKYHERIRTTTTNRHIETIEDVTTTNTEEFNMPNQIDSDVITKVHIEEPKVEEVKTEVHIEPEIENKDAYVQEEQAPTGLESFESVWHDRLKQQENNHEKPTITDILHVQETTELPDDVSDSSQTVNKTVTIASTVNVMDEPAHVHIK